MAKVDIEMPLSCTVRPEDPEDPENRLVAEGSPKRKAKTNFLL